jgi:hypothetical protein
VYNHFVAWSSDSTHLLVERRSELEAKTDGENLWCRHYFYFNLRRGKLEHTQCLLTLNSTARNNDAAHKEYVVPAFAEPLDALPPEKEFRERYEAGERRLKKAYPAFLKRAEDEKEKQDRRRYQQLWLKARESAPRLLRPWDRKQNARAESCYTLATENRSHELEEYLEERACWDEENKKQATKANEAAKGLAAADENRMNGAKPLYKSSMIRNERS